MNTTTLRPVALRVGPLPVSGGPAIEMEFADGRRALVDLDPAHASTIADRLREILDGRICQRPPSRRVYEVTIGFSEDDPAHAITEAPSSTTSAIVPDLDLDFRTQGVL